MSFPLLGQAVDLSRDWIQLMNTMNRRYPALTLYQTCFRFWSITEVPPEAILLARTIDQAARELFLMEHINNGLLDNELLDENSNETIDETSDENSNENSDETSNETIDENSDENSDETIDETSDEAIDETSSNSESMTSNNMELSDIIPDIEKYSSENEYTD